MAVAGYSCLVRKSGTSTAVTAEACDLISGTEFQITAAAKRVIDPEAAWHVKDDTATIAYSAITSVDYVNGRIVLASSPGGSVTFSGSFLPLTTAAEVVTDARSFSLSESTDLLDTTVMAGTTSLHAATRRRTQALKDVELSVESIATSTQQFALDALMANGNTVVTEVYFGTDAAPRFRGFCKLESIERSGEVGGLITSNLSFKIAAVRNEASGLVASYAFKAQP